MRILYFVLWISRRVLFLILFYLSCLSSHSSLLSFCRLYLPWTAVSSLLWPQVSLWGIWVFELQNVRQVESERRICRSKISERNEQQICWLLLSQAMQLLLNCTGVRHLTCILCFVFPLVDLNPPAGVFQESCPVAPITLYTHKYHRLVCQSLLFFSLPLIPESDGYGISSGSGYDIYAPLTSPLYGRLRAQLHMNSGSSIQHPSNPLHNNNLKTSNNNNVSSRTTGNGKSKGGSSSNNNSSSKNLSSNGISNSSGGNNYRAKERLEVMPFDHRSERYASAWDWGANGLSPFSVDHKTAKDCD